MSSYYPRLCGLHGEWDQDVDRPYEECPVCVRAGTSSSQLAAKKLADLRAENARLAGDAERYAKIRAGRSDLHGDVYAMQFLPDGDAPICGERLDTCVDRMCLHKGSQNDPLRAAIAAGDAGKGE